MQREAQSFPPPERSAIQTPLEIFGIEPNQSKVPRRYVVHFGFNGGHIPQNARSALPLKADLCGATGYVGFRLQADISTHAKAIRLKVELP
jgi:hypothetical protein